MLACPDLPSASGSVVAQSEGLIQSYKTGDMIGATPRYLTYVQLLAVPVGAAALAFMYPLLRDTYGFEGSQALTSPISQKWVGFAKLLSRGIGALHPSAAVALVIGAVLGIVFTSLEQNRRWRNWIPSPTGIGIGMLIPATAVSTMLAGAVFDLVCRKRDPKGVDAWMLPLASGMIAGAALVAVILTLLYAVKVLAPV